MKKEYENYPTIAKLSEEDQEKYYLNSISKTDLLVRINKLEDTLATYENKKQTENKWKQLVGIVLAMAIICIVAVSIAIKMNNNGDKKEVALLESETFETNEDIQTSSENDTESDEMVADSKETLTTETEADSSAKVGEIITFGTYEQDGDLSNGQEDIEWIVLEKEDDRILVVSKYALDCQPYNTEYEYVTWENCTLRTWLNNDFKETVFSATEVKRINGEITLLSVDEARKYLPTVEARECEATAFAKDNGIYIGSNGKSYWWLRDKGSDSSCACCVRISGDINGGGHDVVSRNIGVRPALWINL